MTNGTSGTSGWGVPSGHFIDEQRLNKLNLYCTGGGYINGNDRSYFIKRRIKKFAHNNGIELFSFYEKDDFSMTLNEEEFKNIEQTYKKYLRKEKLKKIDNVDKK